jgi:hypothetical protein
MLGRDHEDLLLVAGAHFVHLFFGQDYSKFIETFKHGWRILKIFNGYEISQKLPFNILCWNCLIGALSIWNLIEFIIFSIMQFGMLSFSVDLGRFLHDSYWQHFNMKKWIIYHFIINCNHFEDCSSNCNRFVIISGITKFNFNWASAWKLIFGYWWKWSRFFSSNQISLLHSKSWSGKLSLISMSLCIWNCFISLTDKFFEKFLENQNYWVWYKRCNRTARWTIRIL